MNEQDKARQRAKIMYGSCVICNDDSILIGSHIFLASTYPEFVSLDCNIVALCPKHDAIVEYKSIRTYIKRPAWSRIKILIRYCHDDHREKLLVNMARLKCIYKDSGVMKSLNTRKMMDKIAKEWADFGGDIF